MPDDAGTAAEQAPLSLIYLDVDDEITSAAARIRNAGADEVALVLPFGSRLATSRINFRLLAREAAGRAKKLEIITADASARSLATAAGLPTHASVAGFEAHRSGAAPAGAVTPSADPSGNGTGAGTTEQLALPSPDLDDTDTRVLAVPRRSSPRVPLVGPPRPPVRTGVAIGIGMAVVVTVIAAGLLGLEYLPSATITLHPRSEAIGPVELLVEAREDVTAPDPAAMTIPAERYAFNLEASDTFPATGVKVEEIKATGNVTFSNFDTGTGIVIPARSVVRTEDNIRFVTVAKVTLPRAQIDFFPPFPTHPSTANVGVEAMEPGPSGNVGSNNIIEVDGGGRNLLVTNEQPTSGGARNESPQVSAEDVEAAKTALADAITADLDAKVQAGEGIPDGITVFPLTASSDDPVFTVDPATIVGTAGTEFALGATALGSVLGVDAEPIAALAEAQLASRVDAGWSIEPGSIDTVVGTPDELGEVITYPVTVSAMQVHDVDTTALLAEIRGLGLPEARSRLDDFGDVTIEVWPDWVTAIPSRGDRVTLDLGEPQPSATP